MTEITSNTQSDELQALLKAHGLKPEKFSSVADVVAELKSSKNKIKAQERENRKMIKALQEKQQTDDTQRIDELYGDDPKMQTLARENRALKGKLADIEKGIWLAQNPDYEQFKDEVEELIDTDPDVMRVTDPVAQLNLAVKLVRQANSGSPTGTPREAGGHTLARGAIGVTSSPALPPSMAGIGQGDLETELAKNNEKFAEELKAAKGDMEKKKAIAAKYEKLDAEIRRRFS